MILRHNAGAFFALGAGPADPPRLIDLGWQRHPSGPDVWFTRSPYLAAPLWHARDPNDGALAAALGPYAWNYETSFAKAPLAGTGIDYVRLPAGEEMKPFQIAGFQRAALRNKIMICDQMRLGKTVQSLALVNHVRPQRLLIACPTYVAYEWASACERWLVDSYAISILDGAKRTIPERGIIILPYSRTHSFDKQIMAGPSIDLAITDEFHHCKDPLARRTVPLFHPGAVLDRAKRVVLLSGTPMPNNPIEIYGALRVAAPEIVQGVSRDKFQEMYCQTIGMKVEVSTKSGGKRKVEVQKIVGKSREALNAELRASGVMVRRLKEEVTGQMPPAMFFVHMTPTSDIEALVREELDLFEQLQTRIMTAQELIALKGHIANVRARLGVLKAPKIAEYAQNLLDSGEDRLVVFMLHREAIEIVRQAFERTDVVVHVLTGSESPKERFARAKSFQDSIGGRQLIIGQVVAAGEGIPMSRSRYAILGEISWTPSKNEQAVFRIDDVTKGERDLCAPILTFPHATEERVIRVNARKALDARTVLDTNLQRMFSEAA